MSFSCHKAKYYLRTKKITLTIVLVAVRKKKRRPERKQVGYINFLWPHSEESVDTTQINKILNMLYSVTLKEVTARCSNKQKANLPNYKVIIKLRKHK